MSTEWSQGEDYIEEDVPDGLEEDTPSLDERRVRFIALGAAGVVILLIVLLIFYFQAKPDVVAETDTLTVITGSDDYWAEKMGSQSYTTQEIESLRAWGYTGDEIESFELQGAAVTSLIAESKALQQETLNALSDPDSDAYRALIEDTWIGQEPLTLPSSGESIATSVTYTSKVHIADYEKIPATGHNLFIKVYLEDGSVAFMEVDIIRYVALADTGNIAVSYSEVTYGAITLVSNMAEIQVE